MKIKFLKAFNGDCIWISFLENGISRNIIIDGGIGDTYKSKLKRTGELFETIKYIRDNEQKIDLLILTHFDDDHIGGLLRWFNQDEEAYQLVKKVWFNSGKQIASHFNLDPNNDLSIKIIDSDEDFYTSTKQGIDFEEYLLKHKIWDERIIKQGDVIEEFGLKFKILSPNEDKLRDLIKLYKKEEDYFTSGGEYDFETTIEQFIDEEENSTFKFKEDKSIPNGSSVAFIMKHDGKSYLFLADAHPSVIIEGLNYFGYNKDNPLNAELMKVSHHGSKFNNNKELLEIINTNNYLISSNATKHGLPNKRTIARIIDNNPNAVIYFNYDLKDTVFLEQDWKDYKDFRSKMQNEF